jgi:hypothetical protein
MLVGHFSKWSLGILTTNSPRWTIQFRSVSSSQGLEYLLIPHLEYLESHILFKMRLPTSALLLAGGALAIPTFPDHLESRQSCPKVHVFGARETTAPAGYGTAGVVVNLVLGAYSGSTAEAIVYPACGGQSSCGGQSYGNSALNGVSAVAQAVNAYNTRCPSTQLVLVGYSQVCAHIFWSSCK